MISILDHGAQGDNGFDNTGCIQSALDQCGRQGGGVVYVPPGRYVTGTIRLPSNVTLYLENGAALCAVPQREMYVDGGKLRDGRMVIADGAENIALCGLGAIVGTGQEDLQRRAGTTYDMKDRPAFRSGGVHFGNCRNVTIRDIRFEHSDNWTLCVDKCQDVLIDGVRIHNNYFRTNSDGIDIVSCQDVRVANCNIVAGDDGIVVKSLDSTPCRRVVVTNCIVESCASGLKIGTESFGDFSDIIFSNCVVRNSYQGAGIFIKDGATAERIKFSHCIFATYDDPHAINLADSVCPIFVDVERRRADSMLGSIRDVSFQDITVQSENSIVIQAAEQSPIENLSIKSLFLDVPKDFDFTVRNKPAGTVHAYHVDAATQYVRKEAYIVLGNVQNVFVDDVYVRIAADAFGRQPRHAVWGHQLKNSVIRQVRREPMSDAASIVCLDDCIATELG